MKFSKFSTLLLKLLILYSIVTGTNSYAQSSLGWSATPTACSASAETLTGTVIGTTGSWENNSSTTRDKVFDDNVNTYFDGPAANGQWVGLDLGSSYNITCISFLPRDGIGLGFPRMSDGKFQISNDDAFSNPTTIYTIPSGGITEFKYYYITNANSPNVTQARYIRYLSPNNSYGNIAEMKVYGSIVNNNSGNSIWSTNENVNGYKLVGKAGSTKGLLVNPEGQVVVDSAIYAYSFRGPYNTAVPDYVFEDGYSLKPLSEVENYIKQYRHLPDVPSNEEYKKRGVIDLQEMNLLLLRKIEELTLHLINLDKKTNELQNQNYQLINRINNYKK